MNIFTEELISKLPSIKKAHNPFIVAICKLENPAFEALRNKINEWISLLPKKDQMEMIARITETDDKQSIPAFYELLFVGWFEKLGIPYIKDPEIKEGKPDFLVNPGDNEFYLEVATIFQTKEIAKKEKAFHELLDLVDIIESNCFVGVSINEWLPDNFNRKAPVAFLKRELTELTEIKQGEIITRTFNIDDRKHIEFSIFPRKSGEVDKVLATWSGPGYSGDSCDQIRSRIHEKNKKYKSIKGTSPYIVAICNGGDNFMLDQDSVESALFGRLEIIFNIGPSNDNKNKHTVRRDSSGSITPKPATLESFNTRMSGLIYCHWGIDGGSLYFAPKYFTNPWAQMLVNDKIFNNIPRLSVIRSDENGITLEWFDKEKDKTILV